MIRRVSSSHSPLASLAVLFAVVCGAASTCRAGGGPENVFLVVNAASQDSLTVANHYIDLRKIPARNVFHLSWKRSKAGATSEAFREDILKPILEELNQRKLGGQVDYVIYSCDFPWRVSFEKEFPVEQSPPHLRPTASLTGSTYLWSFVINKRKEMFELGTNFYFAPFRNGLTLSRAFHSNYYWDHEGRRTTENKGIPYLLSTMLGVTEGRGNTVPEIVRYLEAASKADGAKPKGTIYYVRNNSARSVPRHDLFPQAVAALAMIGVRGEIEEGEFIRNKPNVMGVTSGAPHLNVAQSGCRFLPGSLCDNFTSAGGNLILRPGGRPQQTAITEFLRFGAGGASGTVIEPMAIAQKFPSPFLHVHYARGCSMAESFYQAIAGPYQQLIVGDPLCQPWAEIPNVTVDGIDGLTRLSDAIILRPSAQTAAGQTVAHFDLYVDGVRAARCNVGGHFSVDTTGLADGAHELRVVATTASAIESQGRWIQEVIVKNGLDAIEISVDERSISPEMEYLNISVVSSRKDPVTLTHNGRTIGSTPSGSGGVRVAVSALGVGPITLEAQSSGPPALRARPLRVVLP